MDGKEPETDRVDWGQPGKALGDRLRILAAEDWELQMLLRRGRLLSALLSVVAPAVVVLWWLGGGSGEQGGGQLEALVS